MEVDFSFSEADYPNGTFHVRYSRFTRLFHRVPTEFEKGWTLKLRTGDRQPIYRTNVSRWAPFFNANSRRIVGKEFGPQNRTLIRGFQKKLPKEFKNAFTRRILDVSKGTSRVVPASLSLGRRRSRG